MEGQNCDYTTTCTTSLLCVYIDTQRTSFWLHENLYLVLATTSRGCLSVLLRGTILNRTYGAYKNLPGMYFAIFTYNVWFYLLWSPRNRGCWRGTRTCGTRGVVATQNAPGREMHMLLLKAVNINVYRVRGAAVPSTESANYRTSLALRFIPLRVEQKPKCPSPLALNLPRAIGKVWR